MKVRVIFSYVCGCALMASSLGFAVEETIEVVQNVDPRYGVPPQYDLPPPYVPQQQYVQQPQIIPQPPVVTPPVVNYFRPQYNQFDPNYSAWQSYQLLMLPDQNLTDRVRRNISRDRYLANILPTIQIYSSGGIVTLAGAVPSSSVRTKIEMLAKQTNGVYRVDNQLILIRPVRPIIVPRR